MVVPIGTTTRGIRNGTGLEFPLWHITCFGCLNRSICQSYIKSIYLKTFTLKVNTITTIWKNYFHYMWKKSKFVEEMPFLCIYKFVFLINLRQLIKGNLIRDSGFWNPGNFVFLTQFWNLNVTCRATVSAKVGGPGHFQVARGDLVNVKFYFWRHAAYLLTRKNMPKIKTNKSYIQNILEK